MVTLNWLQKVAWNDEVFIDEDGFAHGAGGGDDAGQDDHEMVALKHAIEGTLDDMEMDNLEILEIDALTSEQQQRVNQEFPGFVPYMLGGGLAKDFAVSNWGWIRVYGHNFEVNQVTDEALDRMVDFAINEGWSSSDVISVNEQSTGAYVDMVISEIAEAIQIGQAAMKYQLLARRPQGLY